jgi:SAM-dependent methyltransferase
VTAFDALAAEYDASFTATPLGTLLREAVWRRLDACFAPGDRVLELACGTGEDAVHLARRGVRVTAIDASPAMVETARRKVAAAGLEGMIEVHHQDMSSLCSPGLRQSPVGSESSPARPHPLGPPLPSPPRRPGEGEVARSNIRMASGGGFPLSRWKGGRWERGTEGVRSTEVPSLRDFDGAGEGPGVRAQPFDGAFSNFGGLNCVADLRAVARALAERLRPGAPVLLCVMGPLVPWEWIWYLGQGDPARAFRRLRRGGVAWRGMTVRYPSIRALRRAFSPELRSVRIGAVGALLPPTYLEEWTRRHPRLLAALARWERRLEQVPPLPWLADHYLIELERRGA